MKIQLSDHFNYKRLLRFVMPSIVMMVFTSIYGVVDGLFVSNFVGDTAFAAINLIMPFNTILGGVGFYAGKRRQRFGLPKYWGSGNRNRQTVILP